MNTSLSKFFSKNKTTQTQIWITFSLKYFDYSIISTMHLKVEKARLCYFCLIRKTWPNIFERKNMVFLVLNWLKM